MTYLKRALYCLIMIGGLMMTADSVAMDNGGLGQTIQIYTRFRSFVGKPSWQITIRDIDHNQNIPYVFDIERGNNFWLLFTYGRNYLITVSDMQISTYRSRYNDYTLDRIKNFCYLESDGRINRGESLYITITGDLTTNRDSIQCHVSRFENSNFSVAPATQSAQ